MIALSECHSHEGEAEERRQEEGAKEPFQHDFLLFCKDKVGSLVFHAKPTTGGEFFLGELGDAREEYDRILPANFKTKIAVNSRNCDVKYLL
jgi:hypothetical protein